jgi:hypothetical protein
MAGAGVIHRRLINLPAAAGSLDEDPTRISRCEDLNPKDNCHAFSGQQGRLFDVRADIGSPPVWSTGAEMTEPGFLSTSKSIPGESRLRAVSRTRVSTRRLERSDEAGTPASRIVG